MSTRQPFRMFADFTGADPRFREPAGCVLCHVHGGPCSHCKADELDAAAHPPQLAMDERPFAPVEALVDLMASVPPWGGGPPIGPNPELGFIDRANTPVRAMRRSIHRSHRGEGHNFVD